MNKNTYNPFTAVTKRYHWKSMISEVLESMIIQLGVDISYDDLNRFFRSKGKFSIPNCEEWQHSFAFEKMLEYYHVHAQDETLEKQIEMMDILAGDESDERHG